MIVTARTTVLIPIELVEPLREGAGTAHIDLRLIATLHPSLVGLRIVLVKILHPLQNFNLSTNMHGRAVVVETSCAGTGPLPAKVPCRSGFVMETAA